MRCIYTVLGGVVLAAMSHEVAQGEALGLTSYELSIIRVLHAKGSPLIKNVSSVGQEVLCTPEAILVTVERQSGVWHYRTSGRRGLHDEKGDPHDYDALETGLKGSKNYQKYTAPKFPRDPQPTHVLYRADALHDLLKTSELPGTPMALRSFIRADVGRRIAALPGDRQRQIFASPDYGQDLAGACDHYQTMENKRLLAVSESKDEPAPPFTADYLVRAIRAATADGDGDVVNQLPWKLAAMWKYGIKKDGAKVYEVQVDPDTTVYMKIMSDTRVTRGGMFDGDKWSTAVKKGDVQIYGGMLSGVEIQRLGSAAADAAFLGG